MPPDHSILVSYLRRCYHAVDGLWFMMAEENSDFEHALELDVRVWRVLAKIQARKARELLDLSGNTAQELARAFSLKLDADGHRYTVDVAGDAVLFRIETCPWRELLERSERQRFAAQVAKAVCTTEGDVWCSEFGGEWTFEMPLMGCGGADRCEMRFGRIAPGRSLG